MDQQLMSLQDGYHNDRRRRADAHDGEGKGQEKQIKKPIENSDSENGELTEMLLRVMSFVKLPKHGIAVMQAMKPVSTEVVRHEQAEKLKPCRQRRDSLDSQPGERRSQQFADENACRQNNEEMRNVQHIKQRIGCIDPEIPGKIPGPDIASPQQMN